MKYVIYFLMMFVFIPNTYASSDTTQATYKCDDMANQDIWLELAISEKTQQEPYLDKLKECLIDNENLQSKMDTIASGYLDMYPELYEKLSTAKRQNYLSFIESTFLANANAGYASSQHNYATIHNNAPTDIVNEYIPQDYKVYMEWTCRAATQREPRAIANLAMRAYLDQEFPFINKDKKIAYLLLKQSEENIKIYPGRLGSIKEFIDEGMQKIAPSLSLDEKEKLDSELETFDFSKACTLG